MKAYILSFVLIIISCFLAPEVLADFTNVHIEVEGGPGGKGVAVSRGLDCFIITAEHVVGDDPLAIEVIGADRKTSPAGRWWAKPAVDLAVIKIENPAEICGCDFYINIDYLEQRLEQNRFGVLRIRSEDGSEFDLKVQLVSWDRNYIHVKQQSTGQEIGERRSGSMLYLGRQPVGLLVKVSTGQDKIGYVYRIDRINEQVGKFLPLAEPLEEEARYNDQLAIDILRKHVNYMQTEDFCRNLWRVAKWVTKPEGDTYRYEARRRGSLGGDEYIIKSMLFPGVNSVVTFSGTERKHRMVVTRIGYVPASMQIDRIWSTVEQAIDKCIDSNINEEIGGIRRRTGMRRNRSENRTMWTVERSGFLGISMEDADIWLEFTSREIKLLVWAID